MFKKLRFVTVSAIKETLLIFCYGYVAYTVSDLVGMSGIMSMVVCAVLMAHYAWYSLSPQGKHVSSVAFQVIGFLAESFVFVYLGLAFFVYVNEPWSWQFILIEFGIIIVGRFAGTSLLIFLIRLCGKKTSLSLKQANFLGCAGLIRGAIAFGLVIEIDENVEHRGIIITTCLALIFSTTLLYGSTMGLMQRLLVPPKEEEKHEYDENDVEQELLHSEYEEFKHPNLISVAS